MTQISPKNQDQSDDNPLTFILLGNISPASVSGAERNCIRSSGSKVVGKMGDKLRRESITKMV
jgi:hypothetical protein